MKPWQHGFELDLLRELAAPFKSRYKPFVHGAFGLPKERDVAAAMAANGLLWTKKNVEGEETGGVRSVAIIGRLKTTSTQSDFTGRAHKLPRGSVVVRHVASVDGPAGEIALVRYIREVSGGARVFVEIHEEDADLRRAIEAEGALWLFSKISAGSTVRGVYGWDAEDFEPLDPADGPSISLVSDVRVGARREAVLSEIRRFEETRSDPWAQHYAVYNKRSTWTAFAIRGYDPDDPAFIIKPGEMSKSWKKEHPAAVASRVGWTSLAESFPETVRYAAEAFGGEENLDRVRFMRLEPGGGELSRHADITDRDAGTADGRISRLHFPILSPDDCRFTVWNHRGFRDSIHLREGRLWYLDQRKPHAVLNSSTGVRVHLVVDGRSSESLRRRIVNGAKA